MSTYTSNYAWEKPAYGDDVDIMVLNNNLDDQDSIVHNAYMQLAPVFSASSTYAVNDVVLYSNNLYKCHTAVTTAGAWTGSANWTQVKVSDICGSGGGGTSNYNDLSNKPQINSVELSGNKTSAQLGLMASDGVVANPTGQTTGSLTALEVGGTKYAVGGGSGTSDYTDLTNKPSINGVTLSGNKTTSDLGISYADLTNKPTIPTDASDISYDNTDSGLQATDVQGAVDELAESYPADKVMMSDGVTSVEDKLSGYIAIQNIAPSSALTWTHGDFIYFNNYKPSNTDYTWYLLSVMPNTANIIVCGIQVIQGRALIYLPAGGSIQSGCNITWFGIKN